MVNAHLDHSINIGGTCFTRNIYIKFRERSFNMWKGVLVPRSIWAPLPTPNSTFYLCFSKYLLVEVSALRSQIWTLCLDGNNAMRHSLHSLVNTDLKSARNSPMKKLACAFWSKIDCRILWQCSVLLNSEYWSLYLLLVLVHYSVLKYALCYLKKHFLHFVSATSRVHQIIQHPWFGHSAYFYYHSIVPDFEFIVQFGTALFNPEKLPY